jgi:hypothetical protein
MNPLLRDSSLGVVTVLLTGLAAEIVLTDPGLKFSIPLGVGILWSAALLYQHSYQKSSSE